MITHKSEEGVYKYLDASTCHIRPETDQWLSNPKLPIVTVKHEYGYWIHVPSDQGTGLLELESKHSSIPKDLIKLIIFAREKGCLWIDLDRDGYEHDDLPKYKWDILNARQEAQALRKLGQKEWPDYYNSWDRLLSVEQTHLFILFKKKFGYSPIHKK